ncbi:ribonuclease H-like domain-containing protein [Aspergillus bertholletiae]|uniref:Ribonuclease n=1 Tax=Aspergillus bertholletiae TaxID=1226010 RepID=A0A5N7BAG7_9EURO|nr:ribonuclease H-like domain-containing protein [Aspergillus bertholletiae]
MEEPTQHLSFNSQSTLSSAGLFVPPSINRLRLYAGESYSYYSPCPATDTTRQPSSDALKADAMCIDDSTLTESYPESYFVLGVDEAGRGPVLGPMVYSAFYLPHDLHQSLLVHDYSFNDSKVLTPGVRANLMRLLCTPGTPLFESCGWATKLLSARDISSGMMRPGAGVYNLNAQAMDATVELIREIVEARKVDIREVYIDTIGNPTTYQQKLERIFPSLKITVAKKADSLYPCVSAASVAAKVTRDVALGLCHEDIVETHQSDDSSQTTSLDSWGSGYPSDSKCVNWLRMNMNPIFGWGNECRFSWGTSKEMLEIKGGVKVDWPLDEENTQLHDFLLTSSEAPKGTNQELRDWFGQKTAEVI